MVPVRRVTVLRVKAAHRATVRKATVRKAAAIVLRATVVRVLVAVDRIERIVENIAAATVRRANRRRGIACCATRSAFRFPGRKR